MRKLKDVRAWEISYMAQGRPGTVQTLSVERVKGFKLEQKQALSLPYDLKKTMFLGRVKLGVENQLRTRKKRGGEEKMGSWPRELRYSAG